MKPRPYQYEMLAGTRQAIDSGAKSAIVKSPTGTGKTVFFVHAIDQFVPEGKRALIIAHREELVTQAAAKVEAVLGEEADIEMASMRADQHLFRKTKVVVASVQTLITGRMKRFDPDDFALVIVDECFPAGTLVDGKPIEQIQVGDLVNCYDHEAQRVVRKPVKRLFKSRPSSLVTVHLDCGHRITCTPGHPFFVIGEGYVPAIQLSQQSEVLFDVSQTMQRVPERLHSEVQSQDLFKGVHESGYGPNKAAAHHELCPMQSTVSAAKDEAGRGDRSFRPGILFGGVQEEVHAQSQFGDHEPNQSEVCVRQNAIQKPNVEARDQEKSLIPSPRNGLEAACAGRQRSRHDRPRTTDRRSSWLVADCHTDQGEIALPDQLQGGCGESQTENRHRDRRALSRLNTAAGKRCEEAGVLGIARVDSVQIHQCSSRDELERVCPGGFVFNIEVEEHHNYFAEGVLVHNCHHSPAPSYMKVLKHFRKSFILGVTATPDRSDDKAMAQVFETVAFDYDLPDAISDGWLVEPQENFVPIMGLDWSNCRTSMGDFNQKDLAAAMANEDVLQGIADATIREAAGRRTLVFAPPGFKIDEATGDKFHVAERLTEIFNRHHPGIAERIHQDTPKEDRRRILRDFAANRFSVLVNIGVLTEGFDDPGIEVIAMARPTKSRALYAQCIGRGTRPLPGIVDQYDTPEERRAAIAASGKPFCEVLDFQGNAGKHSIVGVADILGGDMDPIVAKKVKKKVEDGEKSVLKAIKEAEEEAIAEKAAAARAEERRKKIVAKAIYEKRRVDSKTGRGGGDTQIKPQVQPCTPAQAFRLRQYGVDPTDISKRQASAIIGKYMEQGLERQTPIVKPRIPAPRRVRKAPSSADLQRLREQAVSA